MIQRSTSITSIPPLIYSQSVFAHIISVLKEQDVKLTPQINILYHVYNSNSVQQIQIFIVGILYDKYGSLVVYVPQNNIILLYMLMGVSGGGGGA